MSAKAALGSTALLVDSSFALEFVLDRAYVVGSLGVDAEVVFCAIYTLDVVEVVPLAADPGLAGFGIEVFDAVLGAVVLCAVVLP